MNTSEIGLKKLSGYILKNNRHQFFYYTTATIILRYYNTFRLESNQIYAKVRYLFPDTDRSAIRNLRMWNKMKIRPTHPIFLEDVTVNRHIFFLALVECVSVLQGTCLQCAEKTNIHQYAKLCEDWRRLNLSKNPRYTFYTIKSSLRSHITTIVNLYKIKSIFFSWHLINQYQSHCNNTEYMYNFRA